ncbi:glycosyltransferase family 4 protein [Beggiatoa leptomitoformis]|uniref:Glycosyltransferase n=1 Tax=Beggiatoa leptomitoformis TaxID=288004 RepID=A0A2N9YEL5_9GAMM|nr:glycosyltransferase family 4 protein [Beggiatoa leptomitoformis]ALG68712.1 glycosyltransferase [Beggiatoa leptomitoformis]AUI68933.1 glycosyltransferase [Beggiatoa leptomitoformis]
MTKKYKLALLPYHPVPYQVPFYRALHAYPDIDETVLYLAKRGIEEKYEQEWNTVIKWDIPLLEGYHYKFMWNMTFNDQKAIIERINPGLLLEIGRKKYDAILITGYNFISVYIALLAAKISGTKVILRAEATLGNPSTSFRRKIKKYLLSWLLARCDAVMYSCEANRQYFKYFGATDNKLFPLLSSVDNTYLQAAQPQAVQQARQLRQEQGIAQDASVFLFVGRFTERKRPQDIITAFAQANLSNSWLIFVGDGPLRAELTQQAEQLGVKNIIFTGFKNSSEIPAYLALADVFVLPSQYDPTPKALNEALVFGLPALVSQGIGTATDLVKDAQNGFIFEIGNTAQLANYMSKLEKNSELRITMQKASLVEVAKWTPEANAQGVMDALNYCFNEKK